ncbi:histidine kinase [Nocardioides sp. TF02-7]|uniref:sensor histidine kinase n=1 Tax=Nocardioides sp. TF02-7 TaxID=2917724 RepID=UPI001F068B75|nr:histidine kinase [Nocardioides sp. TF02-7]UMG91517.1 histidine kinase [Nocardioides sp. TF02-7]
MSQTRLGLEEPWTGSDLALAATGLGLGLPLLLRRARPLAAAALVAVALPVQDALGGSLSFGSFVAVLVATYSLGRTGPLRTTVLGVGVVLVGVVTAMREALPEDLAELVFPFFYTSAAAGLGAVVGRLADQAAALRRLNEALEREREATTRLAVAGERIRLARDLHDVVAHTLTVAVVQAETCEEAIADDPARARAAAREVQEAGRRGLADLRSMVRVLRDADAPAGEPGLADLETLAAVMGGAGLDVVVRRRGDVAAARLPAQVGRQLFRVVQEALTNTVKHSAAAEAVVTIAASGDDVELTVTDPGPALGTGLPSGGHGLAGMAERVAAHGGRVEAGPHGAGFRVRVTVPVREGAAP